MTKSVPGKDNIPGEMQLSETDPAMADIDYRSDHSHEPHLNGQHSTGQDSGLKTPQMQKLQPSSTWSHGPQFPHAQAEFSEKAYSLIKGGDSGRSNSHVVDSEIVNSEVLDPKPSAPRRKRHRPFFLRLWFLLLVTLGFGATSGVKALENKRQALIRELPDVSAVLTYTRPNTLIIKATDGTILQKIGSLARDPKTLANIPEKLVQAFIASEDRRFYEHNGVDYQAIARAAKANLAAREVVEGGSTITQQLARIVFLDLDRSWERKIREALLAQQIEKTLTKAQILERYLNLVYLGSGAYGITDAAWTYFSKSLEELSLSEIATLAGIAPAPSAYSPLISPDLAKERRNTVLEWMLKEEYITSQEAELAIQAPLEVNPSPPKYTKSPYPYFTTFVQKELPRYVSSADLERGGLVLETTLNLKWQDIAEANLRRVVERDGYYENFSQAALVVVDPHTGAIPVMVGGTDFATSQFNRVTQAQRQPGSTFKTFVYATAIAAGFSPNKTYEDAPITLDGGYKPKNYGGNYRGTVTMIDALISSINIVSLKTLLDVGFDPVIDVAHRMGIESDLYPAYALALGASEVNLLELTGAYGTLANEGRYLQSHGISRITNAEGKVIYDAATYEPTQVIDRETVSIVTWMLTHVVDFGTGKAARLVDRAVAGKTGTSESARDLWFIGYIPQLVTGVWLGNDDNQKTYGSSSTAAYLWGEVMHEITQDLPVEEFPPLPEVEGREPLIEVAPIKPSKVAHGSVYEVGDRYEDPWVDDYYYEDDYWEEEPVDTWEESEESWDWAVDPSADPALQGSAESDDWNGEDGSFTFGEDIPLEEGEVVDNFDQPSGNAGNFEPAPEPPPASAPPAPIVDSAPAPAPEPASVAPAPPPPAPPPAPEASAESSEG